MRSVKILCKEMKRAKEKDLPHEWSNGRRVFHESWRKRIKRSGMWQLETSSPSTASYSNVGFAIITRKNLYSNPNSCNHTTQDLPQTDNIAAPPPNNGTESMSTHTFHLNPRNVT